MALEGHALNTFVETPHRWERFQRASFEDRTPTHVSVDQARSEHKITVDFFAKKFTLTRWLLEGVSSVHFFGSVMFPALLGDNDY